ncbi:hypothetical protein SNEBB_008101 [Seison nebaliae]|nr:hypothetical protein SNEBB_008101 [Seison nebaliae]
MNNSFELLSLFIITLIQQSITLSTINKPPRFDRSLQSWYDVDEYPKTPIGAILFTVRATDPDPGDRVRFDLHGQLAKEYLKLQKNGKNSVNVVVKKGLDREVSKHYDLVISAHDSVNNVVKKNIKLIIWDTNDNRPKFTSSSYIVNIREDTPINQLIFKEIEAYDVDEYPSNIINFELKGLDKDYFYLDQHLIPNNRLIRRKRWPISNSHDENKSSERNMNKINIRLKKKLDYETKSVFVAKLVATDEAGSGKSTEVDLIVNVIDVPDQPPHFLNLPYFIEFAENLKKNTKLLRVKAVDGDIGINAQIEYSLLPIKNKTETVDNYIRIDNDGIIYVNDVIDTDEKNIPNHHQMIIKAKEKFEPFAESETILSITFKDLDDNFPQFEHSSYNLTVKSLAGSGTMLRILRDHSLVGHWKYRPKTTTEILDYFTTTTQLISTEHRNLLGDNNLSKNNYLSSFDEFMNSRMDYSDYDDFLQIDRQRRSIDIHQIMVRDEDKGINGSFQLIPVVEDNGIIERFDGIGIVPPHGRNEVALSLRIKDNSKFDYIINDHLEFKIIAVPMKMSISELNLPKLVKNMNELSMTRIRVFIEPSNMHTPVFGEKVLEVKLNEHPLPNQLVTTIQASDDDPSFYGELTYSMQSSDNRFIIDKISGEIRTAPSLSSKSFKNRTKYENDIEIDREITPDIWLIFEATDVGGLKATLQVHIILVDINDNPPLFTQDVWYGEIEENSLKWLRLIEVRAIDSDEKNNVNSEIYYVLDKNPFNITINAQTGIISLTHKLDYEELFEKISIYNKESISNSIDDMSNEKKSLINLLSPGRIKIRLTVYAIDRGYPITMRSNAMLSIIVHDVNDHIPFFQLPRYDIWLREDFISRGKAIAYVRAIDHDSAKTDNSRLSYSIERNIANKFSVNPLNGSIFLTTNHDISGSVDFEELRPYFENPLYSHSNNRTIRLVIKVNDHGIPSLSSSVNVYIHIQDVNNRRPLFTHPKTKTIDLMENSIGGTVIERFVAGDADFNAHLLYRIVYDESYVFNQWQQNVKRNIWKSWFYIDKDTGEIFISKNVEIDREKVNELQLIIEVRDVNADDMVSQQYDRANLVIKIIDKNDNWPIFDIGYNLSMILKNHTLDDYSKNDIKRIVKEMKQLSYTISLNMNEVKVYHFHVSERRKSNDELHKFNAIDHDLIDTNNSFVSYKIRPSKLEKLNIFNFIDLDEQTGTLYLIRELDYEKMKKLDFYIEARDNGQPNKLYGFLFVRMLITDENDCQPKFLIPTPLPMDIPRKYSNFPVKTFLQFSKNQMGMKGKIEYFVPEDAKLQTIVCQIRAIDCDSSKDFGPLKYKLLNDVNRTFSVDPFSGIIRVNRQLDRETISSYILLVEVADNPQRSNGRPSSRNMYFRTFHHKRYKRNVWNWRRKVLSSSKYLYNTTRITNSDSFLPKSTPVTFSKYSASRRKNKSKFYRKIYNRRKASINFRNSSNGIQLRDTMVIEIKVVDVNDHVPMCTTASLFKPINKEHVSQFDKVFQRRIRHINENIQPNELIGLAINAIDPDEGINGTVKYFMDRTTTPFGDNTTKPNEFFDINPITGEVFVSRQLEGYSGKFKLFIKAIDGGNLSTICSVVVIVDDLNNYAPSFIHPSSLNETLRINENTKIHEEILRIQAVDFDSGLNGKIIYEIDNRSFYSNQDWRSFSLDETSGSLVVKSSLNRNKQPLYVIDIIAKDKGINPRSLQTRTTLKIVLVDKFNNSLFFNSRMICSTNKDRCQSMHLANSRRRDQSQIFKIRFFIEEDSLKGCQKRLEKKFLWSIEDELKLYNYNNPQLIRKGCFYLLPDMTKKWNSWNEFLKEQQLIESTFYIDEKTGNIYSLKSFDREEINKYNFAIKLNEQCFCKSRQERSILSETTSINYMYLQKMKESQLPNSISSLNIYDNCSLNYFFYKNYFNNLHESINDISLLHIQLEILDINDNKPKFSKQIYRGGISSSTKIGDILCEITIRDDDITNINHLQFQLIPLDGNWKINNIDILQYIQLEIDNSSLSSHKMRSEEVTLFIKTKKFFPMFEKNRSFKLKIIATDRYSHEKDEAIINLHIISNNQRIRMVFNQPLEELRSMEFDLLKLLERETKHLVQIDRFSVYRNKNGTPNEKVTEAYLHFLNNETSTTTSQSEILRMIDRNSNIFSTLLHRFKLVEAMEWTMKDEALAVANVAAVSSDTMIEGSPLLDKNAKNYVRRLHITLIVTPIILIIIIGTIILFYCMTKKKFQRKLKAERAMTKIYGLETPEKEMPIHKIIQNHVNRSTSILTSRMKMFLQAKPDHTIQDDRTSYTASSSSTSNDTSSSNINNGQTKRIDGTDSSGLESNSGKSCKADYYYKDPFQYQSEHYPSQFSLCPNELELDVDEHISHHPSNRNDISVSFNNNKTFLSQINIPQHCLSSRRIMRNAVHSNTSNDLHDRTITVAPSIIENINEFSPRQIQNKQILTSTIKLLNKNVNFLKNSNNHQSSLSGEACRNSIELPNICNLSYTETSSSSSSSSSSVIAPLSNNRSHLPHDYSNETIKCDNKKSKQLSEWLNTLQNGSIPSPIDYDKNSEVQLKGFRKILTIREFPRHQTETDVTSTQVVDDYCGNDNEPTTTTTFSQSNDGKDKNRFNDIQLIPS